MPRFLISSFLFIHDNFLSIECAEVSSLFYLLNAASHQSYLWKSISYFNQSYAPIFSCRPLPRSYTKVSGRIYLIVDRWVNACLSLASMDITANVHLFPEFPQSLFLLTTPVHQYTLFSLNDITLLTVR